MQPFKKLEDRFNPSVSLDSQSGKLVISNKSIPLDEQEFLGGIMNWLQHYINQSIFGKHKLRNQPRVPKRQISSKPLTHIELIKAAQ